MSDIISLWSSLRPQLSGLLVNTSFQLALLTALTFGFTSLLKVKSPPARHILWLMVVFSPLLLPLLSLYVPAVNIHLPQSRPNDAIHAKTTLPQERLQLPLIEPAYRSSEAGIGTPGSGTDPAWESSSAAREQPNVTPSDTYPVRLIFMRDALLLLWVLGSFIMTVRFARGLYGLHSLRRHSIPLESGTAAGLLDELRGSLGIRRNVQLASSASLKCPVSFGWLKPVILIPASYHDAMSPAEIRMTLIHELTHIKRHDYPVNVAISLLRIPLFFHPLFIFAVRQLQIQQEHVCDGWVIQLDQGRTAYAQCLLRQAETAVLGNMPSIGISAVSGFRNMRRRINMVLDSKRYTSVSLSRRNVIALISACCAFAVLASSTRILPSASAGRMTEEATQRPEEERIALAEYALPIPSDAPADVRGQIERLHSSEPKDRAEAIGELARMEQPAIQAIPFLIQMLGDDAVFPLRLPPSSYIGCFPSVPRTIGEWAAISFRGIGEPAAEPLLAALKHSNCRVRANAIWALGDIWEPGDDLPGNIGQRLQQQLFVALKDEYPRVRKYAVKMLGMMAKRRKLGNPRAVEIILALLSDRHLDVRAEAAAALGDIGDPAAVEPLIAALKAPSADDIATAREIDNEYSRGRKAILALRKPYSRIRFLREDGHSRDFVNYLRTLDDTIAEPEAFYENEDNRTLYSRTGRVNLRNATVGDALDAFAQATRCRWIARIRTDGKVEVTFRDRNTNEYSSIRGEAARALGKIGDLRAVEPLIEAMKDDDPEVRDRAAGATGKLDDPRVTEALIAALDDDFWPVRSAAVRGLGESRDARSFGALLEALKDDSPNVRARASEALAELNDLRVIEPMITALSDENPYVRWHAAEALKELEDPRAVESLIVALNDRDEVTRRSVIAALGKLRDTRAVEPIIHLLEDEDDATRMDAREALRDITGMKLDEDPKEWREWWEDYKSRSEDESNQKLDRISATGAQIVFQSHRDGNHEIYIMGADGRNPRNLTHNPAWDGGPSWSPDGRRIAFQSNRNGGYEIYIMDADGKNLRRPIANPEGDDARPSWSPDGQEIAFQSDRDGDWEIYVMPADGKDRCRRLTDNPAFDTAPSWSPDGQWIAFESNRDEMNQWGIYVMDADGKNQRRLTSGSANDGDPSWSPDGQKIAFMSRHHGNWEIYVTALDHDDHGPVRLTDNPADDVHPSWLSDGRGIVFSSDRDGNMEIYVMDADGKNQRRLTDDPAEDGHPD